MSRFDWLFRPYLFHVHTAYTDGDLTPSLCADFAQRSGVSTVVFLEHIRRKPRYDVESFSTEVKLAGGGAVRTVLGFEAKVLPDGTLDIDDHCFAQAAVVGIAEHSFPNDGNLLRDSLLNVFRTYPGRWPQVAFVWVHPGLWYLKRHLIPDEDGAFHQTLVEAIDAGILIEQNLRYGLVSRLGAALLPAQSLVTGADAHSLADLERWVAWHSDAPGPVRYSEESGGPQLQA